MTGWKPKRYQQEPVPNRFVEVPQHIYDIMEQSLGDVDHVRHRMASVVRLAYSKGYQDGCRDGHTDAENGHDERVRASLA